METINNSNFSYYYKSGSGDVTISMNLLNSNIYDETNPVFSFDLFKYYEPNTYGSLPSIEKLLNEPNTSAFSYLSQQSEKSPKYAILPKKPSEEISNNNKTKTKKKGQETNLANKRDQYESMLNHNQSMTKAENADKLEKKRDRNRDAARKCRQKKLERLDQLANQVHLLSEQNKLKQAELELIRNDISFLIFQIDQHNLISGCDLKNVQKLD